MDTPLFSGHLGSFNVILTITNAIRKHLPSSGTKMASNYDVHSPPCIYTQIKYTYIYEDAMRKDIFSRQPQINQNQDLTPGQGPVPNFMGFFFIFYIFCYVLIYKIVSYVKFVQRRRPSQLDSRSTQMIQNFVNRPFNDCSCLVWVQ